MSNVEQRVKALVVKSIKGAKEGCINDTCTLDELGADSLDAVELILAVEQEFKINISEVDFEKLSTVGAIIQLVTDKTNS